MVHDARDEYEGAEPAAVEAAGALSKSPQDGPLQLLHDIAEGRKLARKMYLDDLEQHFKMRLQGRQAAEALLNGEGEHPALCWCQGVGQYGICTVVRGESSAFKWLRHTRAH